MGEKAGMFSGLWLNGRIKSDFYFIFLSFLNISLNNIFNTH